MLQGHVTPQICGSREMSKTGNKISAYYDHEKIDQRVKNGHHRQAVGGFWDEIGLLQFNLMKQQGLHPGGRFLASFFEIPAEVSSGADFKHQPGSITTHAASDPYHDYFADFVHIVENMPWSAKYIGNVDHPRAQKMIVFERN